jgi:alpha-D-xyloside xylohydrolase
LHPKSLAMFKRGFILLLLAITCSQGRSQSYRRTIDGLKASVNGVDITVQFFAPRIVRITKSPAGTDFKKTSFSVIEHPAKTDFMLTSAGNTVTLQSKGLQVRLDLQTGALQYYTTNNRLLLAEKDKGARFTPVIDDNKKTFGISQDFELSDDEAVYGLGQHQQGIMNYRGKTVVLRQKNMDIAIPFFQTTRGYGIFWDNYSTTTFRDTAGSATLASALGDGIDYYVMNGGGAEQVVAQLRTLTGNAPMFPRWVFGFWQSRERYKSQAEIVDVVRQYRELRVPLDGIVQDWQYWGSKDSSWNATGFGNPLFPEPRKMVDSVHALNAHMIISVWPSFGGGTAIHEELDRAGLLYDFKTWPPTPGTQVYDAFNPAARDIYWKYINKNLFSLGIDGWWLDATEPEQADTGQSDKSHTHAGSFASVCNAFPLLTTGGVYAHQRETYAHQRETYAHQRESAPGEPISGDPNSGKRVFILTRSAFAGQQRYATATWSGDIQGNWQVFRNQISGGLNLSLSGIPYWNTDIGGFFIAGSYPKGIKDTAFHELYTRWLEFAAFTPLFRSHGTNTPREIYQFGGKGYWAYDAQEKFINLRYRLLPYIYSTAWQVTAHQSTLMRALVMDFPTDKNVYNINDEYMFGKAILVAPVTDSLYVRREQGRTAIDFGTIKTKDVYLPKGAGWIDFWTGVFHAGGHTITCEAPIDQIPLFIRAGSILPFGPTEQYTSEKRTDTLEIRIYPGADGRFTLYEDENDNYDYEKGLFSTIDFRWDEQAKTLSIGDRKGGFPGMAKERVFNVVVVKGTGVSGRRKEIRYSGGKMKVYP